MKRKKKMTASVSQQAVGTEEQYDLIEILCIWVIASLPMVLLTRVVVPALAPHVRMHPGILYWWMVILGMAWEFVVSMWIVYREEGDVRWATIRRRFWLNTPRDPKTGEPRARLFWWLVPGILLTFLIMEGLGGYLIAAQAWVFPSWTTPLYGDITQLATPEFAGAWWLVGIALVSSVFNYFLGEEFLFRGVLLPKMKGVFGKWDWVANSVLFGLYHIHWAPRILSIIVTTLPGVWLSRRFRSNWMEIVIHGVEAIPLFVFIFAVVLGLM
jgi:membrane protease YdiL (CAAX protease family)